MHILRMLLAVLAIGVSAACERTAPTAPNWVARSGLAGMLGSMGDHYSLNADIDFGRGDGTYALDKPQYLVFAPQKNGGRRLAALDYTVPYEKWQSAEPLEFFGIPFTRNDGFGVWMFHIWLYQHNPAGVFANFNPEVPLC